MRAFLRSIRPTLLVMIGMAFTVGIGLGRFVAVWQPLALASAAGIGAAILWRGKARRVAILLAACALGCWDASAAWHATLPAQGEYTVTAMVAQGITEGSKGQSRTKLKNIKLNGENVSGNAYWSFYDDEAAEGIEAGNIVTFDGSVYAPESAQNPDGFDFKAYLLQSGMYFGVYGVENLSVTSGSFDLEAALSRLRDGWTAGLCRVMGAEDGAYAAAMLLGDKSLIPDADREAFANLGMAHVLAVSGFHVGVIAGLLLMLLRRLNVGRWTRFVCLTVALTLYCMLTGMSSAVVRATILMLLFTLGRTLQRKGDLGTLLSAAAIVILAVRPAQLMAAGFQLTFGAMIGMAVAAPFLQSLFPTENRRLCALRNMLCRTAGAQLGLILPLTHWYQSLPTLAFLLNLPGMLYCMALMYLYLATCVLMGIPVVGMLMGSVAAGATRLLVRTVTTLSELPTISLWTTLPNALTVLGVIGLLAALHQRLKMTSAARVAVSAVSLLITVVSLLPATHTGTDYVQLSVGNADAAVLRDGAYTCVIDTGEDETLARYLHQRRCGIDLLILTHLHSDHAGGLDGLLRMNIPVAVCCLPWDAEKVAVDPAMSALVCRLAERGTEIRYLAQGDRLTLPSGSGEVLWPVRGAVMNGADANLYSLAIRWTLCGTSMLTTGDLDGA